MVSVTLSIPEQVKEKMEHFQEVNWSGFIRKMITEKTEELAWQEEMQKKLGKEQEINEWAIRAQKEARKGRFKELKKKGLL